MDSRARHVQLIIFDLDGTLIDSALVIANILNKMRLQRGMPALAPYDYVPWLSHGGVALISSALDASEQESNVLLEEFRRQYVSRPTPVESVYPGVFAALEHLRSRKYLLSLCTNKPRALTEKVLDETSLSKYFAHISAGGDLPSSKPAKENVEFCLDYYSIKAERSVMVGDSIVDQHMAKKAGMPFLFYTEGYNAGLVSEEIDASFSDYKFFLKY